MAKCTMCGAEVIIGERCLYCGSMAEPFYYPVTVRLKEKIKPPKPLRPKQTEEQVQGRIYTIQRGDNLWNISKKFYGNGIDYHKILKANPQITDPNYIYPGQTITIPK